MKVEFDGKMEIKAPLSVIMKYLTDVDFIGASVPDSQNFVKIDDDNFTMDIKVGVGFVSGVFEVKGSITEKTNDHMTYNFEGGGIGSTVRIVLSLDLSEKGKATNIDWKSETELNGLVSGVNEAVLRSVSEKKIKEIVSKVKSNLEKKKK